MAEPTAEERRIARENYQQHLRTQRVANKDLNRVLRDAADDAARQVERTTGRGIGAQIRRAQYMASRDALRRTAEDLFSSVESITQRGLERASAEAVQQQTRFTAFLAEVSRQEQIPVENLRRMLTDAAETAGERVRSRLINDIDLSPRVYRNQQLMMGQVDQIVNRSIAQNRSAREIAQAVRGSIRPDTPGGVSYAAKRLGRTEINNAYHTTTVRSAQSMPFVTGMKWTLSASHPRTDTCDDYAEDASDNLGPGVYKSGNVPFKPHPQCLCFVTNVSVKPSQFDRDLLSGRYDGWLMENGMPGIGTAA